MKSVNHCERYGDRIKDIFIILKKFGFLPYIYNPFERDLITFKQPKKFIEQNIIFIKDLVAAKKLLKNSEMIKLDSNFKL